MEERVMRAHGVIDDAIAKYDIKQVYALFSGGHDSLTTTHVTAQHPLFKGVLHIDTGIGIPQTKQYVIDTCEQQGWPLFIYKSAWDYVQLVTKFGFPGPDLHSVMYRMLKERALDKFMQDKKTERLENIGLVNGARSQESKRRMGHLEPHHKQSSKIWISAIHDWSALDCSDYIAKQGLKRNPVKDKLHISGECLCGSFADPMERREIAFWFPEIDELLSKYEQVVQLVSGSGINPIPQQQCRWGWHDGIPAEQGELFPLCHFCYAGREDRAMPGKE